MSAGGSGAIGPVSVRYAAQIREMLQLQAMQRMAAEQEAARATADAERAARIEAIAAPEQPRPITAKVETTEPVTPTTKTPDVDSEAPAAAQLAGKVPGQLVDIQA